VFSVRRRAGAFTFLTAGLRPLRTSWLIVGNENLAFVSRDWELNASVPEWRPRRLAKETDMGCPGRTTAGTHEGVPHAGHRLRSIRGACTTVN
jgi:hypothetical protein